jgi:hypothetical protein
MAKYTYYITVPVTTSVNIIAESDEKIEDEGKVYDLAIRVIEKANTRFYVKNNKGHESDVELGEELSFHEHLNRGNVCNAVCSEMEWYTEGEE